MGPKKSAASKASLKKANTMAATAAAGQEFLKQAWGADKLSRVNELIDARHDTDPKSDDEPTSTSGAEDAAPATTTASAASKPKAKPKLSKARTMRNTAKEAKALIGGQVFGDTRADTKRRLAAVKATKALREVSKPAARRKPALKRLGTMAKTAREGKAYVKRAQASKGKGKKRATGRGKKSK